MVQQVGEEIEAEKNIAALRAIFLAPLAVAEFAPKEIARSSPGMLLLVGHDIRLLHVTRAMRQKQVASGMAGYLTVTAPAGSRLFVRAAACLSGPAARIWGGVGFISSSSVCASASYTRQAEGVKSRPPRGVDTLYLSFVKQ